MYVHSHLQHFVKSINKHHCSGIVILMIYQRASLHLNLMSSGTRALSYVSGYLSHLPWWLKSWALSLFYGTKLKSLRSDDSLGHTSSNWVKSRSVLCYPGPVHAVSASWLLGPLDYRIWNLIWRGSSVAQRYRICLPVQETGAPPLGRERSSGEGNGKLLRYSCLGNRMDRGAWWTTVRGGHRRVRQNLESEQQQQPDRHRVQSPWVAVEGSGAEQRAVRKQLITVVSQKIC